MCRELLSHGCAILRCWPVTGRHLGTKPGSLVKVTLKAIPAPESPLGPSEASEASIHFRDAFAYSCFLMLPSSCFSKNIPQRTFLISALVSREPKFRKAIRGTGSWKRVDPQETWLNCAVAFKALARTGRSSIRFFHMSLPTSHSRVSDC